MPENRRLPDSGPLSLSMIQGEFGGANPISLSEYYGVDAPVPPSGTISVSDFYGTSDKPPVPPYATQEFGSSTTWTAPLGITRVKACMIGGGAGGDDDALGGYAGNIFDGYIAVTGGEVITVTIGQGGESTVATGRGGDGTDTVFKTTRATGHNSSSYEGNGGARTTCYGTAYDGIRYYYDVFSVYLQGGQAGLGNGGHGAGYDGYLYGGDGIKGGGGGGGLGSLYPPGDGGDGWIRIEWGVGIEP